MEHSHKYKKVQIPELAKAIARSIVDRDFGKRLPYGLYKKDEKGNIETDPSGDPIYTDQAMAQLFHLFIFYSGMVKDHLIEIPLDIDKINTKEISKDEQNTSDIVSKIKNLFKMKFLLSLVAPVSPLLR